MRDRTRSARRWSERPREPQAKTRRQSELAGFDAGQPAMIELGYFRRSHLQRRQRRCPAMRRCRWRQWLGRLRRPRPVHRSLRARCCRRTWSGAWTRWLPSASSFGACPSGATIFSPAGSTTCSAIREPALHPRGPGLPRLARPVHRALALARGLPLQRRRRCPARARRSSRTSRFWKSARRSRRHSSPRPS